MARRPLAFVVALSVLSMPAFAATAQEGSGPVVTNAVQVTDNPEWVRGHSSPVLVRNAATGELVIVETNVYSGFGITVHISADEGRTWRRGGDPMLAPFTWNSDLAINGPYFTAAFDRDNVLHVAFSAADPATGDLNRGDRPRPLFLAKSDDSGRTFTTTYVYRPTPGDARTVNNRRPMLAIDPRNPSNVYVGWIQTSAGEKARAMMAASSDGGHTFGAAVDLAEAEPTGGYQPRPAVTPDGVVHAVFPSAGFNPPPAEGQPAAPAPVRAIFYRQSTDGGNTWSPPVTIDQGSAGFFHNRKQLLAADPNNGNLYLVWYGNAKDRPTHEDNNDILLRVSRDGGATWGERVVVNDDTNLADVQHYDPGISIAPNGRVDIAWYDFRNSPMPETLPAVFAAPFNVGGFTDVYYASSNDGGRSFGDNVRISDRMSDRRIGMWSNNVHSHYNVGLASSDDAAYFAWQDSRNGNELNNSEDIYFASLWESSPAVSLDEGSGVPGWVLLGTGIALGMGVAMMAVYLIARRGTVPQAQRVSG